MADIQSPDIDNDGYPTDEWLAAIAEANMQPPVADEWLRTVFPEAVEQIPHAALHKTLTKDIFDKPIIRLEFSTGGWSGAEGLIEAALTNFWIRCRHIHWTRGGLYIFELPPHP